MTEPWCNDIHMDIVYTYTNIPGNASFRGINTFTGHRDKASTAAHADHTQRTLGCSSNGVTLENIHLQPIRSHMQTLYMASSSHCFVWTIRVFIPLKLESSTGRHQFIDSSTPSGMVMHLLSDIAWTCWLHVVYNHNENEENRCSRCNRSITYSAQLVDCPEKCV